MQSHIENSGIQKQANLKNTVNLKILPSLMDSVCCRAGRARGLAGQTQRRGWSASRGTSGLCGDLVWTVYEDTFEEKKINHFSYLAAINYYRSFFITRHLFDFSKLTTCSSSGLSLSSSTTLSIWSRKEENGELGTTQLREKPTFNAALSPISCLHCRGACQLLSKRQTRQNKTKEMNIQQDDRQRQLKTSLNLTFTSLSKSMRRTILSSMEGKRLCLWMSW